MSSTPRKDKRHLWWKQHAQQVDEETNKPKQFKRPYREQDHGSEKEQPKPSLDTKSTESEESNDKKTRFIVFVGNLPFDIDREDVMHHFRCTGGVTDFRLMTKKDGGASKGCGFLELDTFACYEKALNLHHSVIGGRKVNVEVTCGGGGSGEKRIGKLNEKKKKFRLKRGKNPKSDNKDGKSKDNDDSNQDKNKGARREQQNVNVSSVKKKKKRIRKNECSQQDGGPNQSPAMEEDLLEKGTSNTKKEKKQKRKHESFEEGQEKKKSLINSDVMSSIVKDLELETLVKEKQQKTKDLNNEKQKKTRKKKKLKLTEGNSD